MRRTKVGVSVELTEELESPRWNCLLTYEVSGEVRPGSEGVWHGYHGGYPGDPPEAEPQEAVCIRVVCRDTTGRVSVQDPPSPRRASALGKAFLDRLGRADYNAEQVQELMLREAGE